MIVVIILCVLWWHFHHQEPFGADSTFRLLPPIKTNNKIRLIVQDGKPPYRITVIPSVGIQQNHGIFSLETVPNHEYLVTIYDANNNWVSSAIRS